MRQNLPELVLAVMVLIVLAFAGSRTASDPDLWGHVRFGQDILAAHSLPRQDPYSFTSDQPWVNHEWLAEVLMAGGYTMAGSMGLIALKWALYASTMAVLWHAFRRSGVFPPVAVGLLLAATVGVYPLIICVRPQLFSLLGLAIELALMNGIARRRTRLFLWMPVVFASWANLHGGWIVGAGVLVLWTAAATVTGIITWPWAAAGTCLALLGSLITPYGVGLWRFLWETVGFGRADIGDWQPLTSDPAYLIPWALTAFLVVMAWRRCGVAALAQLVPVIALGILALRVIRLEGMFALTSVMLLAPTFAAFGPRQLPLSSRPTRSDVAVVGVMCLAGLVATTIALRPGLACVTIPDPDQEESWAPEPDVIAFFQQNQLQGRLLSYFDYGEIAIWYLAPRIYVSYDGRRETVYSPAVQEAHNRFYSSRDDASYAKALKADYIWLPHRLPVIGPLGRDGWVAVFRGSESVVLAREAGQYKQPAPRAGLRCFPGP